MMQQGARKNIPQFSRVRSSTSKSFHHGKVCLTDSHPTAPSMIQMTSKIPVFGGRDFTPLQLVTRSEISLES